MSKEKSWFAVYTKPRSEKKVAERFSRLNIENYCPLNKVHRQWSDRKKVIEEPLFTSYVFVHIDSSEQQTVRQTDGVINFVYWVGKPAVVRDEEIDMIKRFLNEFENVKAERTEINPNDLVRIVNGPLLMREGSVLEVKNKTVKVLLPTLGYTLIAEIGKANVERISKDELGGGQQ